MQHNLNWLILNIKMLQLKIFLFHQMVSFHAWLFIIFLKMQELNYDRTFNQQQPYFKLKLDTKEGFVNKRTHLHRFIILSDSFQCLRQVLKTEVAHAIFYKHQTSGAPAGKSWKEKLEVQLLPQLLQGFPNSVREGEFLPQWEGESEILPVFLTWWWQLEDEWVWLFKPFWKL